MDGATGVSTATANASDAGSATQTANQQASQPNVTEAQQQQVQQAPQEDLYTEQNQQQEQQSDDVLQEDANQDFELQTQNLDEQDTAELKNFAKQLGLNGKQAQAITDVLDRAQQGFNEDLKGRFDTQVGEWRKAVQNDPELGGQNFANTKLNIGRVMQRFGNPEVRQLLNTTGIGYNPAFVRFMNAVGSVLGNDTGYVNGAQQAPTQQQTRSSVLQSIYSNSPDLNF